MNAGHHNTVDTRIRLLHAAEWLFIEHGYEAMSLRRVTSRAKANLAAVNYHFGSKEALVQELLSRRLNRLNEDRLRLLDLSESGGATPDCEQLLGVLFVPALRLGRNHEAGGPAFMRLLGRVYSDASPFIRDFLRQHYQPIFGRFFEAFARALPQWPRNELGLRLNFTLKALAGVLAADDMDQLVTDLSLGEKIDDAQLLARLISLVAPALTAPFGSPRQIAVMEDLLQRADTIVPDALQAVSTQTRPEVSPPEAFALPSQEPPRT